MGVSSKGGGRTSNGPVLNGRSGPGSDVRYCAVSFDDLPGWRYGSDDDLGIPGGLRAYLQSLGVLREIYPNLSPPDENQSARDYFENRFTPYRVSIDGPAAPRGFFTGYFEPVLNGSRTRRATYSVPVLKIPDDLIELVDDAMRPVASAAGELSHGRVVNDTIAPYYNRREIELGALEGRGLEICYLDDPVGAFILHVQGSGVIAFEDGERIRVSYAAKNGYPYTSIGQLLINDGVFDAESMTLEALTAWLKAAPELARGVMWRNESYVFFEELGAFDDVGQVGVRSIRLTAGHSLAVDTSIHDAGLPAYLVIDDLQMSSDVEGFRRLMVMQDTGSAIRGAARGDIFYGTGPEAGDIAGRTRHYGDLYVFLPRNAGGA